MNFSSKTKTLPPLTLFTTIILFFFFCCCCFCLHGFQFFTDNYSENKFMFNFKADNYFKNIERSNVLKIGGVRRVLLGGPGSSPPRCMAKCGGCMPCKPVHVAVPPGTKVTTEYYPEAWRCKCGNKLYMP